MKKNMHIPSLAELFNQSTSPAKVNDSATLPTLSDLLRSNAAESDNIPSLSALSDFHTNRFARDNAMPSLTGNTCIPSLSELSNSPQYSANFPSLKELNQSMCGLSKEETGEAAVELNGYPIPKSNNRRLCPMNSFTASSEESGAGSLPSLINLLSFRNSEEEKELPPVECKTSVHHPLSPSIIGTAEESLDDSFSSLDLLERQNSRICNLDVDAKHDLQNKIVKKDNRLILKRTSSFSKVVGAELSHGNSKLCNLQKQLDQTFSKHLPAEIVWTNFQDYDIDVNTFFTFSVPSPDDVVLSHQEKAFERSKRSS